MERLRNEIKSKSLKGLYLFCGEEKYLIKKYEKSFIDACLSGGFIEMNLSVFEGKNVTSAEISGACETLPFMGDKKLVVVRDSGLFAAGRKNESERMEEYFNERFSEDAVGIVLLFVESDVDKRGKAYKTLNKLGKVTVFEPMKEGRLITWIKEALKKKSFSISSGEAAYLIRVTNGSMENIEKEIEKLTAYKEAGKITKEDIDAICAKTSESRVYDLTDAIAAKNRASAITLYSELLELKETPVGILAMLGRQFRIMLKCRLLAEEGMSLSEIVGKLGGSSYGVGISYKQSKSFSSPVLKQAVLDCAELDARIKTGLAEPKLGVEMLIIKYT